MKKRLRKWLGEDFFNYRDRRFGDKRDERNKERRNVNDDVKCFNCQRFGHIARNCVKPKVDIKRENKP